MPKQIKTKTQLMAKLSDDKFVFNDSEFEELLFWGYYHLINSYTTKEIRTNGKDKKVSDILLINKLNLKLSNIILPILLQIETYIKQRYVDTILDFIEDGNPYIESFIKFCSSDAKDYVEMRKGYTKILSSSIMKNSPIVENFYSKNQDIPFWALIELLTVGEFMTIFSKDWMSDEVINSFNKKVKMQSIIDSVSNKESKIDNFILKMILNSFKKIRNNIAHCQPIIDSRGFEQIKKGKKGPASKGYTTRGDKDQQFIFIKHVVTSFEQDIEIINLFKNVQENIKMRSIFDYILIAIILYYNFDLNKYSDDIYIENLVKFLDDNLLNNQEISNSDIFQCVYNDHTKSEIKLILKMIELYK